jgi:acyl-CoA oxidase
MAAALKATGTWHATATIQECREACGGQGYLRANRLAALKADTDVFTTFEGDNTVLLQLVAKNLLTGFKHEFEERDAFGTAAFFAGQVFEAVAERSALRELIVRLGDDLIPGRDDEGDLLERESQLETMRWREEHVLASLARRLRGGMQDDDTDPFELLIACQDHLVLAARSYVDRVVLEAFADAVARAPEGELRELLGKLCDLHAIAAFERERGWFQEHGRFSSTRSKAVIQAVNTLCEEIAPHARLLVDAFGVPESCLAPAGTMSGGV